MVPHSGEASTNRSPKYGAGRLSRRTFIERIVALVYSTAAVPFLKPAAVPLLAQVAATTTVVWQTENDTSGTYPGLARQLHNIDEQRWCACCLA